MARAGERRGERGVAAVEFAILLPLLVTLLFGFIQFGIAFNNRIQATNAAREGARIAIVGVQNWADVTGTGKSFWQVVQERSGTSGLTGCTVTSSNTIGGTLTVEFDYPVDVVIPFVPLPSSFSTGHARAEMRIEQVSVLPLPAPIPGPCP
jgi:Flp pilus assembly protein TadG